MQEEGKEMTKDELRNHLEVVSYASDYEYSVSYNAVWNEFLRLNKKIAELKKEIKVKK